MRVSSEVSGLASPAYLRRSGEPRGWFVGQFRIFFGLASLAAVTFVFASLATWSIADPSLSNANGNVTQNAGGYAGSVIADLLMQFSGLASVIALVPPTAWAWRQIRQMPVGGWKLRIACWLSGSILAAAAFACLPRFGAWPLPSGLGGVAGDLVMRIPGFVFGGFPAGIMAIILGAFAGAGGLVLVAISVFWAAAAERPRRTGAESEPDLDDDEDADGQMAALGALAHWYLSLRAWLRRGRQRRGDGPVADDRGRFAEAAGRRRGVTAFIFSLPAKLLGALAAAPDLSGDRRGAVEPSFAHGRGALSAAGWIGDYDEEMRAPDGAPGYGERVHDPDEPSFLPDDESPFAPRHDDSGPSGRVQTMKRRLPAGRRQLREAQPSLLGEDGFQLPQLHLLAEPKRIVEDSSISTDALEQNARMLEGVLEDFGVKGEIINVRPGPVVALYELEPAPGIKSSRVIGLADDIARSMSAIAARVAVVPGRNAIGIELPNLRRQTVYLRELLASKDYDDARSRLTLVLGKTIGGEPVIADLARMPHLLVAGTTGSGKSVAINTMILSILYRLRPDQVRLIMIDPKMLELSVYDGIPHLLTPVVTDPKKAVVALKWTVREMEERYRAMSKLGVRNIDGYNQRIEQAAKSGKALRRKVQTGYDRESGEAIFETEQLDLEPIPYIVVVIDEMADLMMVAGKDIEGAIQRLAQMARAAGIHVIMATQRPSVDVITGTIKANFPTRISFQVTSKIDSRTILGEQGAEQLLGMGDMLYMASGGRIQRVHGPFVSDEEVEKVVAYLKTQGVPQYLDTVTRDDDEEADGSPGIGGDYDALANSNDLYDQAVAIVLRDRKASTSYIQRRLGIGYNRAASLIERMEREGLIGAANATGKREILVPAEGETI